MVQRLSRGSSSACSAAASGTQASSARVPAAVELPTADVPVASVRGLRQQQRYLKQ